MNTQGNVQAQKRPQKTLNLHTRLLLDTETAYNNKKSSKQNNNKK